MSVFDCLPVRKDGTKVTPWDDDWTNDVSRGIFEPQWSREKIEVKRVWNYPDAIKTGEKVDPGLMMMFTKGAYKKLFDRLYGEKP